VSKVQDCHFINDYNGETKLVSAPQSKPAWSRVQEYHIIHDNGETTGIRSLGEANLDLKASLVRKRILELLVGLVVKIS